jgi:hypothetical protein
MYSGHSPETSIAVALASSKRARYRERQSRVYAGLVASMLHTGAVRRRSVEMSASSRPLPRPSALIAYHR